MDKSVHSGRKRRGTLGKAGINLRVVVPPGSPHLQSSTSPSDGGGKRGLAEGLAQLEGGANSPVPECGSPLPSFAKLAVLASSTTLPRWGRVDAVRLAPPVTLRMPRPCRA